MNKETLKTLGEQVEESVNSIITYQTLPPQIDYTEPYLYASIDAERFLKENLSAEDLEKVNDYIDEVVNDYYDSGIAELDAMF